MSEAPRVSVCIPVYNGAAHLADCLRSVATQDVSQLEIVIGDDNSSDGSLDVIAGVREEFPGTDWQVIGHPSRLGMAGNWNACVEAASGQLIKVMGQDDILYPGCLAAQAAVVASKPDVAVCACAGDICAASGRKIPLRRKKHGGGIHAGNKLIADCLRTAANPIGEPVTTMFRKTDFQKTGGFDLSMRYYIDVDMWLRLLGNRKFAFIEKSYCGFRVHRGGASFTLQGEGYSEFLRMENKLGFSRPLPQRVRFVRRISAFRDSCLRLAAYRIFGSL
jgi:glycosyltransferase involved in cell wall biosynthesis